MADPSLLMLTFPREEGQEHRLTCMWLLAKWNGTLKQFVSQEILGEWLWTNHHELLMECFVKPAKTAIFNSANVTL